MAGGGSEYVMLAIILFSPHGMGVIAAGPVVHIYLHIIVWEVSMSRYCNHLPWVLHKSKGGEAGSGTYFVVVLL
jgi:hypothetical protein